MIPHRYSPSRMLTLLRIGFNEIRDDVSKRLEARRPHPAVNYDPDADLCGRFAEALRRSGFEEQADSVWKIGSSDRWEDHAHAFAEAVIKSGGKEAARVAGELVSDCLEHFASAMTAKAIGLVKADVHNLYRFYEQIGSVGRSHAVNA